MLTQVEAILTGHGLQLNPSKCMIISFCHGRARVSVRLRDGTVLQVHRTVRYLGVLFDQNLTFSAQRDKTILTLRNAQRQLAQSGHLDTRQHLPRLMKELATQQLHGRLQFCLGVWEDAVIPELDQLLSCGQNDPAITPILPVSSCAGEHWVA